MNEVMEQPIKKEAQLKADMVRLNGFNDDIEDNQNQLNSIQKNIEAFLTDEGLDKLQSDLLEKKIQLKKDYALLKTDIGERGLAIYKKTDNTDPAPGVKLKKHDNRELIVDPVAAIEWCIEKELVVFLNLDEEKYADQLGLGTMKDQPGELDTTPIYKASISLKPYQDK